MVTVADVHVTMSAHEVFPHAPLQLVVFELRYERQTKVGRELLDALTPLVADGEVDFGAANVRVTQPGAPESALFHILDRAGTLALTVWPTSLTLESSDYQHFGPFRDTALATFAALSRHLGGPPLHRLGLRYVDEIHPDPSPAEPAGWARWIRPELVGLASVTDGSVTGFGGGVTVDLGDDCTLSFRYSTVSGPAVESGGLLRLRRRPATPAVVLDTDGYWQPTGATPVSHDRLAGLVDQLHDAISGLFTDVTTDDSRSLFRTAEQGRT